MQKYLGQKETQILANIFLYLNFLSRSTYLALDIKETFAKSRENSRTISKITVEARKHCIKKVRICCYSGPYFPAFGP